MRKFIYLLISCFLALPMMAEPTFTLVLDAGHGGKDPGAVGRFSKEKDLNLKLALKVGEIIESQYPDVKVVYTRSTDVFIPLQERADIANKNNADLFISIHTNSSESKKPCGVETFILGTDRMEANLEVAMRENAVMKLEENYQSTYQGFDPNSIDSYIMFELMQNNYMDQSLQFAEQVQRRFVGHLNREDRGVRQAAFWVLLKTACPSILFEMGFISNPEEEKFLNQNASIVQMANAIVNAFGAYTRKQKMGISETPKVEPKKDEPKAEPKVEPKKEDPKSAPMKDGSNTDSTPMKDGSKTDSTPMKDGSKTHSTPNPKVESKPEQANPRALTTYYAIQICASKNPMDPADPKLQGVVCDTIRVREWLKYYTEVDTDRAKVAEKLPEYKKKFPDCWIIKFEK